LCRFSDAGIDDDWHGYSAWVNFPFDVCCLGDPWAGREVYRRRAASGTSQALAIARDELAAAEEQWLTLEMLREQIDDVERKS
jgi:hypothetical protein